MLPEHVIQTTDRAPYEVSKALRGFLRTLNIPDQMVVGHKIYRIRSVPFGQRLAVLEEAVVRDGFQAIPGDEVDHTRDTLSEIFFCKLQCRQQAACFAKEGGWERVLTSIDEEMYDAFICISGTDEEDFCGIIAAMEFSSWKLRRYTEHRCTRCSSPIDIQRVRC